MMMLTAFELQSTLGNQEHVGLKQPGEFSKTNAAEFSQGFTITQWQYLK